MSMTPNEEILSIIRYAPGPIGAAAIYEQCKSIENINDVSSRLSQLFGQGKVTRHEITTANNRKGFAYTLKKADAAPEAASPNPAGSGMPAPAAEDAPAPAQKPKRKPKVDPVVKGLDQVEAALKDSPAPAPASVLPVSAAAEALPGADAARLADAILASLRRQLAPAPAANAGIPASMSIHIAHLEIHLGGL